jgi:predicted Zn-dependent protease
MITGFPARAAMPEMTIIRDVEIEETIRDWATPVFKAAGLAPESVNIILVQSPQLNAFVAGGSNIFIYTGLIQATKDPGELLGVIAHETGHIEGGHLVGASQAIKRASYESILGMALGIGAAILTGDGRAASAISMGAQGLAVNNYLSHTRLHESAADQAAVKYFQATQMNPAGLVSFLKQLEDQELLPANQQQEYVRTHPLTQNRVATLERSIAASPYAEKPWSAEWVEEHNRMKAKLVGFIDPGRVQWEYNDRDTSFSAAYARTIASYRQNRTDEAVRAIDALLALEPENPFLHELKGQMLVDFGRVSEALPSLRKAVEILPDAGLLRIMLSHAMIETASRDPATEKAVLNEAIDHLETALISEPRSTRVYRLLATAYGRVGNNIKAKLNLAEEAVLKGQRPYARKLAEEVVQKAPAGSREVLKAQDILAYLDLREE